MQVQQLGICKEKVRHENCLYIIIVYAIVCALINASRTIIGFGRLLSPKNWLQTYNANVYPSSGLYPLYFFLQLTTSDLCSGNIVFA